MTVTALTRWFQGAHARLQRELVPLPQEKQYFHPVKPDPARSCPVTREGVQVGTIGVRVPTNADTFIRANLTSLKLFVVLPLPSEWLLVAYGSFVEYHDDQNWRNATRGRCPRGLRPQGWSGSRWGGRVMKEAAEGDFREEMRVTGPGTPRGHHRNSPWGPVAGHLSVRLCTVGFPSQKEEDG